MTTGSWIPNSMTTTICGRPMVGNMGRDPSFSSNTCDINSIASPDNVFFDDVTKTLLIAEDTSSHQNDATWTFNPLTGEMTRILTSPYGAEFTSTSIMHIGDCTMVQAVIQHPYGESDTARLADAENTGNENYLGFLTLNTNPSSAPTSAPNGPTAAPSLRPSGPTMEPTRRPSNPSFAPTAKPTGPTFAPSNAPATAPVSAATMSFDLGYLPHIVTMAVFFIFGI